MTAQTIVRMAPDLKARVNSLAKTEGRSVSEIVRELLEEYVRNRDIGSYIDDLWERMGGRLSAAGFGSEGVENIVRDVSARS